MTILYRALGLLLVLLSTLPLYRLLNVPSTGHAGVFTVSAARDYASYQWSALLLLLIPAVLLGRFASRAVAARIGRRGISFLQSLPVQAFAAAAAMIAFIIAAAVNHVVLSRQPNIVDAIAQLVHARYVAAGHLAGPVSPLLGFWQIPLTIATDHGWVSQYPPAHVMLLAIGLRLGIPDLITPLAFGGAVFFTALLAERLFAGDRVVARLGTLLFAFSPFAAAHAAAYMNHTTAALFATCAVYGWVRMREAGGAAAAMLLGAGLGLLFATRPLGAVVVGALVALAWLGGALKGARQPPLHAAVWVVLAALPILGLLGWYNFHFFGSPLRFGYIAALGPRGGLGFGTDPWSNWYGVRAAIGYTSAELVTLNLFLLETPIPAVTLAGVFVALAPKLDQGSRFVVAWAMLPLFAHFFYWHHGILMGPRMLNEYAPAWCLLVAASVVGLMRLAPSTTDSLPGWSPRALIGGLVLVSGLYAAAYGIPRRLRTYHQETWRPLAAAAGLHDPAIVFLHGNWKTRIAMQLVAGRMRQDSVESLIGSYSTCEVHDWLVAGKQGLPVARTTEPLMHASLAEGSDILIRRHEVLEGDCAKEAASDRFGVSEVGALLWQGGLPGLRDGRVIYARDLGPPANARLIAACGRDAYVLHIEGDSVARLRPYDEAMHQIWMQP